MMYDGGSICSIIIATTHMLDYKTKAEGDSWTRKIHYHRTPLILTSTSLTAILILISHLKSILLPRDVRAWIVNAFLVTHIKTKYENINVNQ